MAHRPVHRTAALLVFCLCVAGVSLTGQTQSDRPQFRSATDLVVVDVTVLGRGGKPETDLQPADFALTVDGKPRRIQSVRLVTTEWRTGSVSTPAPAAPPDTHDTAVAAMPSAPRRFVIVVDREHIPIGEGQQLLNAAASFVDSLPRDDRVALWTTTQATGTLRFSENRAAIREGLLRATGTFRPTFGHWNIGRDEAIQISERVPGVLESVITRECYKQPQGCAQEVENQAIEMGRDFHDRAETALENLRRLVDALGEIDGPKHVVLVTGGPVQTRDNMSTVAELGTRAALARVIVHALQVHLSPYQARADQMRATPDVIDQMQTASYMVAGATGGLAITPLSGEVGFKRLTEELSAGYLLLFEAEPADHDGKVHEIGVKVRDRGWGTSVHARRAFRIDPAGPAPANPAPAAPAPASTGATGAAPAAAAPAPEPVGIDPGDMADRLADYAELFERHINAVVAEERFVQVIMPWRGTPPGPDKEPALGWLEPGTKGPKTAPVIARRQLVADVLMVQMPGQQWQSYRDVAEVDGQPVRDRADRVQQLFLSGGADRVNRFQQIALESSRYNLGDLKRDLNLPTVTLSLLRRANHARFEFKRQKDETVDGRSCRVLAYREKVSPTLISTRNSGDVFLYGRVWLEQGDGRIRRTELRFDRGSGSGGYRSYIRVDYGEVQGLDILVPVRLWEWYEGVNQVGRIGGDLTGEQGLATYAKYRKFQVSTSEAVK